MGGLGSLATVLNRLSRDLRTVTVHIKGDGIACGYGRYRCFYGKVRRCTSVIGHNLDRVCTNTQRFQISRCKSDLRGTFLCGIIGRCNRTFVYLNTAELGKRSIGGNKQALCLSFCPFAACSDNNGIYNRLRSGIFRPLRINRRVRVDCCVEIKHCGEVGIYIPTAERPAFCGRIRRLRCIIAFFNGLRINLRTVIAHIEGDSVLCRGERREIAVAAFCFPHCKIRY